MPTEIKVERIKIYGNNRLQQLRANPQFLGLTGGGGLLTKKAKLVSIKRIIIPKFLSDLPKH